jgi:hypothetical protein
MHGEQNIKLIQLLIKFPLPRAFMQPSNSWHVYESSPPAPIPSLINPTLFKNPF